MARLVPWIAALLVVGAMAAPALLDPPTDGFPLSTYPMFAVDRGEQATIATAVGRLRSGEIVRLSPRLLAGADEPILAVRTAGQAVAAGRTEQWCIEIAGRVSEVGPTEGPDELVSVEVRSETHDVLASVVEGAAPLAVEVHAECPVSAP